VAVSGSVTIEGAGAGRPAKGSALHEGDVLHTAAKAGARIELRDGTKLDLSPSTRIEVERAGLKLSGGRVLAQVAPQQHDFVVHTPQAEARVLGTVFSVETRQGDTTLVTVARGAVRVANAAGETVVPAGAFTAARAGLPPLPAEQIDTAALFDAGSGDEETHAMAEADLVDEIDATRRAILEQRLQVQALREDLDRLAVARRRERRAHRPLSSKATEQP